MTAKCQSCGSSNVENRTKQHKQFIAELNNCSSKKLDNMYEGLETAVVVCRDCGVPQMFHRKREKGV